MEHNTKEYHYGYNEKDYKAFKNNAWKFLILFSILYATLYCTRNNLVNTSALLISEMGFTTSQIGFLTSILFWTCAIGALINGRLAEIIGPYRFIVIGFFIAIACNILFGFSSSLFAMSVLWAINGFAQSSGWAQGLSILTKWWPTDKRGFAIGFADAFTGFGNGISQITIVFALWIAPNLKWRAAFIIPPLFTLSMLFLFLIFARESPSKIGLKEYIEKDSSKIDEEERMKDIVKTHDVLYPYKYVLQNKNFLVWLIIAFIIGVIRYGLINWIPLYLTQIYGFDISSSLVTSLILPVGMGVGTLIMPWLTDIFFKNNRLVHVIVCGIIASISIFLFFLLDPNMPLQMLLIEVLLFISGFCIYAIDGISWTYATEVGGRIFSGTSSGTMNFACYIGAAVQSILYGFFLKTGGWNIVFISMAMLMLVIAELAFIFSRKKNKA